MIRIDDKDMRRLLDEVAHLRAQRDELQRSNTALLERARAAETNRVVSAPAVVQGMTERDAWRQRCEELRRELDGANARAEAAKKERDAARAELAALRKAAWILCDRLKRDLQAGYSAHAVFERALGARREGE